MPDTSSAPIRESLAPPQSGVDTRYNADDADLILLSKDGMKFSVHSLIMRLASGFFKDMISVPQPQEEGPCDVIHMEESGDIIRSLLDIIYPDGRAIDEMPVPPYQRFVDICRAAEKYDMPSVLSTLHLYIQGHASDVFASYHPIDVYGLACRYNWMDFAKLASTQTLRLNFRDDDSRKHLAAVGTDDVLRLMELRSLRRETIVNLLQINQPRGNLVIRYSAVWEFCKDPSHHFSAEQVRTGTLPGPLIVLQHRISEQMERDASGAFLRGREFWDRKDFNELWNYKCRRCDSNGFNFNVFDKDKLIDEVRRVLNELPHSI